MVVSWQWVKECMKQQLHNNNCLAMGEGTAETIFQSSFQLRNPAQFR